MTREEAIKSIDENYINVFSCYNGGVVLTAINQIFDEHEAELKQAYIDGSNSNNGLIKILFKTHKRT